VGDFLLRLQLIVCKKPCRPHVHTNLGATWLPRHRSIGGPYNAWMGEALAGLWKGSLKRWFSFAAVTAGLKTCTRQRGLELPRQFLYMLRSFPSKCFLSIEQVPVSYRLRSKPGSQPRPTPLQAKSRSLILTFHIYHYGSCE
jgi:hypothetical protein